MKQVAGLAAAVPCGGAGDPRGRALAGAVDVLAAGRGTRQDGVDVGRADL